MRDSRFGDDYFENMYRRKSVLMLGRSKNLFLFLFLHYGILHLILHRRIIREKEGDYEPSVKIPWW